MSDLLEDFKTFFVAGGLITADACYVDTMLDSPDEAVAIYEYQGGSPLPQITSVLRSVQFVVRSKDPTRAKVNADALYRALETESGIINLTAERWGMLALRQPPFKMKVDTADRTYFVFNAGITTYND